MDKYTTEEKVAQQPGMTRRDFVKGTGGAGLAVAAGTGLGLFGGQAPAFAQSRELHILEWSSFIKPADVETNRQAAEFGKQEGIKVRVEHINANDLNARATAAVESGAGAPHSGQEKRSREDWKSSVSNSPSGFFARRNMPTLCSHCNICSAPQIVRQRQFRQDSSMGSGKSSIFGPCSQGAWSNGFE